MPSSVAYMLYAEYTELRATGFDVLLVFTWILRAFILPTCSNNGRLSCWQATWPTLVAS